jgi:hypothetical protein
MRLVLYLASERTRPAIAWDESCPRFHVKHDDPDAALAAQQFTKPHVHYIGSNEGCGCGFRQEHDYTSDDPEQEIAKRNNQQYLYDYVASCLSDESSVELFSVWSGDEQLPVEHSRNITLPELLDPNFSFLERQLTTISLDVKIVG